MKKGFTLIELLVVIAIIGLLSTFAIVSLGSARTKARDSKRIAEIRQIQTALELYFVDKSEYPEGESLVLGEGSAKALCSEWNDGGSLNCTGTVYMGFVPQAATPQEDGCEGKNDFVYTRGVNSATYTINFCLGSTIGDLGPGVHTADQNGIQ